VEEIETIYALILAGIGVAIIIFGFVLRLLFEMNMSLMKRVQELEEEVSYAVTQKGHVAPFLRIEKR
jgi:hypothetical protein